MDESGSHSYESGQDAAGELAALEAAQQRLWATLRQEDDPELRMSLLSQFSENRVAIGHLRAQLGIDGQPSNGGPTYQVEIVSPTPADRPTRTSRLPYPATEDPAASGDFEPRPVESPSFDAQPVDQHVVDQQPFESQSFESQSFESQSFESHSAQQHPVDPSMMSRPPDEEQQPAFIVPRSRPPSTVGPQAHVDRSMPGAEDGSAHRSEPSAPPMAPPTGMAPSAPVPGQGRGNGSSSDPDGPAADKVAFGVLPEGTADQLKATFAQVPPRALWLVGGVVALIGLVWLFTLLPLGGDGTDGEDLVADTAPAGPSAVDGDPNDLGATLRDLGYDGIAVEDDGETIYLSGTVASEADRAAVIGAARALAQGRAVDGSGLVVPVDENATTTEPAPQSPTDVNGRPAAMQSELDRVVASTPIIFQSNEASLTALHERILNSVASILLAYPDIPVSIVGFTDGQGSNEGNRELSLLRADAVRSYLVAHGVAESSLTVEAMGEETATGSSAIGILERRVEFRVAASASPALAPNDRQLKIAIVAPSARNDLAFTQSMVDAANVIAAERGNVEVSITDATFVPEEAAAAIRGYAEQDYDLVIAHGSQFGAPLIDIATQYPDVAFAWGTASDTFGLPNVYAYDAAAGEGGFVMGALAAQLTRSNVIGVVGPIEVGDAQKYVDGFAAGAKAEKAGVSVPVAYTGSFSDLTLAAETAQGHVDGGADVMTGSAQMVVGAVSIASESQVLWFGTQANQTELAPTLVVASQVYHWEVILREIIADIDNQTVAGEFYTANLANGGLVIEYNPGFALPEPVRQRGDQLVAGIISGSVAVPG